MIYDLKSTEIAFECFPPLDVCTHVGTCVLVIFSIPSAAPFETEPQLYLSSINQKIHWQFYSLLLPVTVFFSWTLPFGIFINYSLSKRGNFKITNIR